MRTRYWIAACFIITSALGCSDSPTPPDSTSSTYERNLFARFSGLSGSSHTDGAGWFGGNKKLFAVLGGRG
ncbi:MAG: hypothetical protein AAF394_18785, partial [Planctomycetota bacterium]